MVEASIDSLTKKLGYKRRETGDVVSGILVVRFKEGVIGRFHNNGLDVDQFLLREIITGGIDSITPGNHIIKGKGVEDREDQSRRIQVKVGGKLASWVPKEAKPEDLRLLRQKLTKEIGFAEDIRG